MSSRERRGVPATLIACLVTVLAANLAFGGDEDSLARSLVQVAGTSRGLALHVGCGRQATAALTAALAERGLVVHGLALDPAAAKRAREAVVARGLAGRAMVECVPAKPLPYLDNLADIVVVEDMAALARAGVSRAELTRVLAPGGALCVLEGGGWTKTVKPRPQEMDVWTHPFHGPDGNMVSTDRLVKFPLGLRWIEGLAMNLVRWAGVRGWVVSERHCFALSSTEIENIGKATKTHYLVARDAWNGLPLWKIDCETTDDGSYLTWVNAGPLATDGERVYATKKDKLIAVEAATGKFLWGSAIGPGPLRQNDLLRISEGKLLWHHVPIDPKTSSANLKAKPPRGSKQGGMMDNTWTTVNRRRAGNAFACGSVRDNLLAWNESGILTTRGAVPRQPAKPSPGQPKEPSKVKAWRPTLPPGAQVEALALARNVAIYAGRIRGEGQGRGFVAAFAVADGRKLLTLELPAPVTYEGIAVAGEPVFVSLQDGSLICLSD